MFLLQILFFCILSCRVFAFPSGNAFSNSTVPDSNYQQKWEWFIRFADAFMYPNNTAEAAKINSTLFSENVQGRVDLTSTFDGRELNTEVSPHRPPKLRGSIFSGYFRQLQQSRGIQTFSTCWVCRLIIR